MEPRWDLVPPSLRRGEVTRHGRQHPAYIDAEGYLWMWLRDAWRPVSLHVGETWVMDEPLRWEGDES